MQRHLLARSPEPGRIAELRDRSRVDLNRMRMTLPRTADGWKVSAVDAL